MTHISIITFPFNNHKLVNIPYLLVGRFCGEEHVGDDIPDEEEPNEEQGDAATLHSNAVAKAPLPRLLVSLSRGWR